MHVHRLRSFALTDTVQTFRKGPSAYRELRDWAKETRDEAIRKANGRSTGSQDGAVIVQARSEQAHSSGSEPVPNESDIIIHLFTNNIQTILITNFDNPDTLMIDPLPGSRLSSKRSNRHSKEYPASQRKRHNAGDSDDGRS
jgi:hypothetical protein